MQSGRYDYQDIIRHKTYQEPPSFYGLSPGDHDWAAGFLRGLGGGRASFDRCHRARGQLRPELAENQWVVGVWLCFGALFSGRRNKFLFTLAQYAGDLSGHGGKSGPLPRQPREMFFRGAMPVTHVRRPCSVQVPETRMACWQQVCRSRL